MRATRWVWEQAGERAMTDDELSPDELVVLLALAWYTDERTRLGAESRNVWATRFELANLTAIPHDVVELFLNRLVTLGLALPTLGGAGYRVDDSAFEDADAEVTP